MHEQAPPTIFVRSILAAGLLALVAGCDHEAPARVVEIDRHAAQELFERREEPTPLTPAEIEAITIEEPTLRDVADGRIDAPRISSRFGLLDEDGEILEPCSSRETEAGLASEAEMRDLTFDVTDEALLELPLHEACALVDGRDGSAELVSCEGFEERRASLDPGFDLVRLDDPAAEECYTCSWSWGCALDGWNARKNGTRVFDWCITGGHAGCC